jgi:hypothetical protein
LLKIQKQRRRLRQLHNHANDFRGSLSNFLSSKSTFISRFISSLVNEVRQVYVDINQHIIYWLREALAPLHHHNQYQKHLLEQHMLRLAELQGTKNTLAQQVESLQTNYYQMQAALRQLEPLYHQVIKSPMQDRIEDNLVAEPVNLPIKTAEVVDLSSKRIPRH